MLTSWLPVAALLGGVALLWLGLRGRRVDDHLLCGKCGRDLFGLEPLPAKCPECGTLLRDAGMRSGNRERRPPLLTAGGMLGAIGALWLAGSLALLLAGTSADPYKPVWLLAWELDGSRADRASAELQRRLGSGAIAPEQAAALARDFLDDQGDLDRTWAAHKGDFIEAAALAGHLTRDEWQRYIEQGVAPAIRLRPRVSVGRTLPIDWELHRVRLATGDGPVSGVNNGRLLLEFDVVATLEGQILGRNRMSLFSSDESGGTQHTSVALRGARADETVDVGASVERFWPIGANAPPPEGEPPLTPRVLAQFDMVPADQSTARAMPSEEMRRLFEEEFSLSQSVTSRDRAGAGSAKVRARRSKGNLWIDIHLSRGSDASPLPLAVAAELWIEDGENRYHVIDVTIDQGSRISGWGTSANMPPEFASRRVTVRLRPSMDVSEATTSIHDFWNGEVVWEDVEVLWDSDE